MDNYYKNELEKLVINNEYQSTIVMADSSGNKTKHLSLNIESIPKIIEYLNKVLDNINKK